MTALVRTLIDCHGCDPAQLRANSALYSLVTAINKSYRWEELTSTHTGTWMDGEEHHTFHATLHLGHLHLLTLPERKICMVDVVRPEVWAPDAMLRLLQGQLRPAETKVLFLQGDEMVVDGQGGR